MPDRTISDRLAEHGVRLEYITSRSDYRYRMVTYLGVIIGVGGAFEVEALANFLDELSTRPPT